jgi:pimeloyl-ACP methyl ester carboxylesterase
VDRIAAGGFEHVVIRHGLQASPEELHIYFSGDGTPWLHRTQISRDPTPREPLEVRLMFEDPTPSIYIGRPCYVGLAQAPGCSASLWTDARYSDAVVTSMTAAVNAILATYPAVRHVVLIGYSGGGVLAMLVADRVARVDLVVTIAANLDIDAWTALHGYSPLSASINPAEIPSWRVGLRQIHLVGEKDRNVPPQLVHEFAANVPDAQVREFAGFDHRCCWTDVWPQLATTF